MKEKWETPRIVVEKFAPNDYISACYEVTCITPNNNASFNYIYKDSNGDGRLDWWGDQLLLSASFRGDAVKEHTQTYPSNNGFVVDWWGNSYPVFVFYKNEGGSNIHVADLTNPQNTQVGADISTPQHPNRS